MASKIKVADKDCFRCTRDPVDRRRTRLRVELRPALSTGGAATLDVVLYCPACKREWSARLPMAMVGDGEASAP